MSDDSTNEDDDPFIEDPRITKLVREAPTITEVLLNAEFLLDEYVTAFLKAGNPETYRMVRTLSLTPSQKFLLVVGNMGQFEDANGMGQSIFGFLNEVYQIRAKAGSGSEEELLACLTAAYIRTGGDYARKDSEESDDIDELMRGLLGEYLTFAQFCMQDVVMDADDEDEDDDGDSWKE